MRVTYSMWRQSFLLLSIFQIESSLGDVITGKDLNPSCMGSLTITNYNTKTVLHKINNTILNIIIERGTRVVVKQTGNCCHHVFNRKNCRGKSILASNNEGREIEANKHSGELSVVKFDAGDRGCKRVSQKYSKAICEAIRENGGEAERLRIDDENNFVNVSVEGDVYNVTDVSNNETVINIAIEDTEPMVENNIVDASNETGRQDKDSIGKDIVNKNEEDITIDNIHVGALGSAGMKKPNLSIVLVLSFFIKL